MERLKGKFWPHVRPLIWQKAQELFQMESCRTMGEDFIAVTATRAELREGGYFYRAKLIVLRALWLQKKGKSDCDEVEQALMEAQQERLKEEKKQ